MSAPSMEACPTWRPATAFVPATQPSLAQPSQTAPPRPRHQYRAQASQSRSQ